MADTENKTNEGPSTSQKSDLTRAGSLINPLGTSIKGRNDTAKNMRGGDTSGRGSSNNNNFGRSVTTRLTVSGVAKEANKSLLKTPETKTRRVLNDTAKKNRGSAPAQRNVSGVAKDLFNVKKTRTYKVANVAKKFMKERVPPKAERRLVRKALESKFGRVRIPSASPPNNSKAMIVYTGPKSGEGTAALANRINEPESGKGSGRASSKKVSTIKIKVLKKREQKPRARRMRRPAKRESPKPKTPETETEKTSSGPTTVVKPRSRTITNSLPTNGQSTASETKPKPKKVGPITAVKKRSPIIKKPLPPNGQPKTVITVNNNSVEKIISAIKNSKPKSKTPPSVNIKRFLEPFKQPVSIQFAPTIQATGGSSKSNAMATQIQPDKSAKKKKPFKKFDVLADPAPAYRKSVAASKRKEIMSKLRTPTVGQRKKHVIQLIDKELRLMKVPKDIERKIIAMYSKALSEKQIKQLFGGRSAADVKKILKKQVDYFKKKKR
jgi:hypothetical protein